MTYAIAAIDPATAELGVAVQTRRFNVGAFVPWSRAVAVEPRSAEHVRRFAEAGHLPGAAATLRALGLDRPGPTR